MKPEKPAHLNRGRPAVCVEGMHRPCKDCNELFALTSTNPRGWRCVPCRSKARNAHRARRRAEASGRAPTAERKVVAEARSPGWDSRHLGAAEALHLAQVWRSPGLDCVTRNCDAEETA